MKIFHLPDLGEGLAEAEIREWYVKEGDEVTVDQPIVSMETAKAVVDVPAPYAGKIVSLHGKENDVIQTGAALVTFKTAETNEPVTEKATASGDQGSVVGKMEAGNKTWDDSQVKVGGAKQGFQSTSLKIMPAARLLATELNVNLEEVKATGPNGLITLADVRACVSGSAATVQSAVKLPEGSEALHGVRRVMAQAMMQSHREIVPVTIFEDADLSHLAPGSDVTVLLLKAIAAAVKKEPAMNAWFDGKSLSRKIFDEVNIGLALDSEEGLFVPVIKDVVKQSDTAMRDKINEYKISVKDRSIAQADMQGATITLSNFGTIAGKYATPIIVPPAVAILGCGRSRETVIAKNGQMAVGKIMPLSLTFDHRAATGGEATRFLGAVIEYLQSV